MVYVGRILLRLKSYIRQRQKWTVLLQPSEIRSSLQNISMLLFHGYNTCYLLFYRPNENLRNSAKLIFCHLKEQMNFKIKGYQSALWLV